MPRYCASTVLVEVHVQYVLYILPFIPLQPLAPKSLGIPWEFYYLLGSGSRQQLCVTTT
jgi:hypothetical protein